MPIWKGQFVTLFLPLVATADLFEISKPHRAKVFVDRFLVCGVHLPGLPLNSFDELAVGAVALELEHFSKQRFVGVSVSLPAFVGHFVHKPIEELLWHVVNRAVDSRDHNALV